MGKVGETIKARPPIQSGKPAVTVVVAVLNDVDTIDRCLSSIAAQTYPFTEPIVIDGGSRDGTKEIIERYRGSIAYFESKPDNGIFHAWNKALKRMKGDWACFLGADDFLREKNVLEKVAPFLEKAFPEYPVVYMNAEGILEDEVVEIQGGPWDRKRFFDTMYLSHQSVLHHRSLFEKYGDFDESYRVAADYDFLLRCFAKEVPLYIPDITLSAYTVGGLSNRIETADIVPVEALRARKKNGAKNPSIPLLQYLVLCKIWKTASKSFGRTNANKLADLYRMLVGKPPVYLRGDRLGGGSNGKA